MRWLDIDNFIQTIYFNCYVHCIQCSCVYEVFIFYSYCYVFFRISCFSAGRFCTFSRIHGIDWYYNSVGLWICIGTFLTLPSSLRDLIGISAWMHLPVATLLPASHPGGWRLLSPRNNEKMLIPLERKLY